MIGVRKRITNLKRRRRHAAALISARPLYATDLGAAYVGDALDLIKLLPSRSVHETATAARWTLLLIVRTLSNDAITVAVWTGFGFHVCLPVDIFASLTRQPNVMHRGSIARFLMWGTWAL